MKSMRFVVVAVVFSACSYSGVSNVAGVDLAAQGSLPHQTLVTLDRTAILNQIDLVGRATIAGLTLPDGRTVDVALNRRTIPTANTQFVIGRMGFEDETISDQVAESLVLQGSVAGQAGSFVFLALSASGGGGILDLGGGERYRISHRAADGSYLPNGSFILELMPSAGGRRPDVAFCSTLDSVTANQNTAIDSGDPAAMINLPEGLETQDPRGGGSQAGAGTTPLPGPHVIRLAVETDNELFELFGDAVVTASYVAAMFAEVSLIYQRDVDARVDLTYVRVWDHWNDLFNEPDPLASFRAYWNANMQAVPRDVAQFVSGRRDLPYGGVAYLGVLCGNNAYSVVGYMLGMFPNPQFPSVFHYDIFVTAHELGHNCNAPHTHGIALDDCFDLNTPAQRGTIMSYCSQTVSGGNGVSDLRFHSVIQSIIEPYLEGLQCLTHDCNGNGIADETEISGGGVDINGNGVLDVCEDCNGNGTLDPDDITNLTSLDVNTNDIPDECEPDCNGNTIPDASDIVSAFSDDDDSNNVPDECQTDCDSDGIADAVEILADMTLDRDRDAILDACQDCDNDGMIDLVELDNAHAAWLAGHEGGVRAFHAGSGVVTVTTDELQVNEPNDVLVTPDYRILVTSSADHRVVEFNRSGATVGDFVTAGAGGLSKPAGIALGLNGNVLVASNGTNAVLEYDRSSGAFVGAFVMAGSGGLVAPFGLEIGPNGNLFVTSNDGRILEYDGVNGAFLSVFVTNTGSGGLDDPRCIAFKPDGNLLAASFSTRSVLEYNGVTGNLIGKFNRAGTDIALTMAGPWGVRIGPDGQVYISRHFHNGAPGEGGHDHDDDESGLSQGDVIHLHVNSTRIYMFDAPTGNFIRSYVTGNDTGLRFSAGFDFQPGWDIDCNNNQMIDSCDISSGASADVNGNSIPDECEIDCNGNGIYDRLDIWPNGAAFDCNANGIPDACDIESGTSRDCNGDGRPDECQTNTILYDNFERDRGWTTAVLGATSGQWQRGLPVSDPNWAHDPLYDADFGGQCWLTQNTLGSSDVGNGSVRLISPVMDMSQGIVTIRYEYYLRLSNTTGGVDRMLVEISSNGAAGPWTVVATHNQDGFTNWRYHQIDHADLDALGVSLTANMQMRFTVNDANPQSIVEAGLDTFHVTAELAPSYLNPGDLNCDCRINGSDIGAFVEAVLDPVSYEAAHPTCNILLGDISDDGFVDVADSGPFVALLLAQ
ncbi:MAG: hypothetical protein IPK83_15320 [Planctomycetes bacterium]|nr:hypothetical protein [Planctomycetota bacterium]